MMQPLNSTHYLARKAAPKRRLKNVTPLSAAYAYRSGPWIRIEATTDLPPAIVRLKRQHPGGQLVGYYYHADCDEVRRMARALRSALVDFCRRDNWLRVSDDELWQVVARRGWFDRFYMFLPPHEQELPIRYRRAVLGYLQRLHATGVADRRRETADA